MTTADTPLFQVHEVVAPDHAPEATIQQRFEAFHAANPWVADALEALTEDWLARGHDRAGLKQFLEVVRWEHGRRTTDRQFRLNNNWTSRYARLLIDRRPEWAEVFATRELRAA